MIAPSRLQRAIAFMAEPALRQPAYSMAVKEPGRACIRDFDAVVARQTLAREHSWYGVGQGAILSSNEPTYLDPNEMSMQRIGFMLGGLVVLVGSFLITNWILSKNDGLNWKFTNEATLAAAATAAGFHQSKDFNGHVDMLVRADNRDVRVGGWAADISGNGSPIALNVFVNGRNITTFYTNGPRPDISGAIKANPKANPNSAKNTLFIANFSCAAGRQAFHRHFCHYCDEELSPSCAAARCVSVRLDFKS